MEFDWYSLSITVGVIAVVGYALFKKVKNVTAVAKEAKEALVYMFHPDSEGGTQPTTKELIKTFKEVADVVKELKKKDDDE